MPDSKIVNLTEKTATQNTDEFVINDVGGGNVDKKVKLENIHKRTVTTKSASATLTTAEEGIILLNPSTSAMTITLPAASGNSGLSYKLIYISTTGQPVVIDGNASETINGRTTQLIENYGESWELYCDGSNWFGVFSNNVLPRSQLIIIEEDFASGQWSTTLGISFSLGWSSVGVGTEGRLNIAGESNRVGIVECRTGNVSGDDHDLYLSAGGSLSLLPILATVNHSVIWMIRPVSSLTSVVRRYGLSANPVSNSEETNENALFLIDTAVSNKWRCRTRSSGGTDQTTTDSGGADVAVGTWYKLKIVRDGGTVRFYINDVHIASHSTQVPSTDLAPVATIDTTAAAIKDHDIDYFLLRAEVTR